jgi:hypothetical protein
MKFIKISKIGPLLGLVIWLYDFDFFLNAGGPSTPISDNIVRFLHLTSLGFPMIILAPLIVLVLAGWAAGKVIDIIIKTGK